MQKIKDKNKKFRMNTIFSLQSAIGSRQFEGQNIYFFQSRFIGYLIKQLCVIIVLLLFTFLPTVDCGLPTD